MEQGEIIRRLGIEPNAMQKETTAAISRTNKDVVVLSPTGSGKTLAYLIPLVEKLRADVEELQAVVLVPGRELAIQSNEVMKSLGSRLKSMALYGGRATMDEHRLLRKLNPQIVFATPGRLNDHLDKQNLSAKSVEYLVIDEFDKCLEMGFRDEMIRLVGKLNAVKRRILLSATESEIIPRFVNMQHIERIDYRKENKQLDNRLSFFQINSPEKDKLPTLRNLLLTLGEQSSIVFLNYRDAVERTATFLCEQGFAVSMFHGGLEQSYREAALYKFSNGAANIMVSTNLGARGLDIPDVENIINYHIPENGEEYVHRIGRTARWNKTGNAFFILNHEEQMPEYVREEMQEYSFPVELPKPALARMVILYIGKGKKDNISKGDVLGFLCKKGGLNSSDVGRIDVKERYTYAAVNCSKLSQVLRLTKGEKIKGINTLVEEVV